MKKKEEDLGFWIEKKEVKCGQLSNFKDNFLNSLLEFSLKT